MIYIYTDGACKGNPGKAGYGCAAYRRDPQGDLIPQPIWTLSEYIGHSTNNIAEYSAIKYALLKAVSDSETDITIYSDSNLAIQQLNGKWKVKNKGIKVYYDEIKKIIYDLNCSFVHVKAHCGIPGNEMADQLANDAILKQNLP